MLQLRENVLIGGSWGMNIDKNPGIRLSQYF